MQELAQRGLSFTTFGTFSRVITVCWSTSSCSMYLMYCFVSFVCDHDNLIIFKPLLLIQNVLALKKTWGQEWD
jgi:hypothetical protein